MKILWHLWYNNSCSFQKTEKVVFRWLYCPDARRALDWPSSEGLVCQADLHIQKMNWKYVFLILCNRQSYLPVCKENKSSITRDGQRPISLLWVDQKGVFTYTAMSLPDKHVRYSFPLVSPYICNPLQPHKLPVSKLGRSSIQDTNSRWENEPQTQPMSDSTS